MDSHLTLPCGKDPHKTRDNLYNSQIQVRNSSDIEITHKLAGATFITTTVES